MEILNKILDILRFIVFSGMMDIRLMILFSLYIVGLWGVFVKCGLKGWWALIPVARVYKLALCADREQEGRLLTSVHVVLIINYAISCFAESGGVISFLCVLVEVALFFASIIYEVRVFSGLCRVFERRRLWILPWLLRCCGASGRNISRSGRQRKSGMMWIIISPAERLRYLTRA